MTEPVCSDLINFSFVYTLTLLYYLHRTGAPFQYHYITIMCECQHFMRMLLWFTHKNWQQKKVSEQEKRLLWCARHAQSLGGERLLQTWQQELLAEDKGVYREVI